MVAALGDDIFALITQAVQQVYLLYARGDLIGAVINLVAVLTHGVALGLLAQQGAQGAVGIPHAAGVAVNVNERNPGLLLQSVQVIGHAVLLLAYINNHLGTGLQQGFQVQLSLAAVQLAQQRQIVVLIGDQPLGLIRPAVGDTNHHIGSDGEYHDLGQRAGNGDLTKIDGQGHFAAQRVSESAGSGLGIGGRGGIIVLSAAGQRQGGDHHDCQQNAKHFFHVFFSFCSFFLDFITQGYPCYPTG